MHTVSATTRWAKENAAVKLSTASQRRNGYQFRRLSGKIGLGRCLPCSLACILTLVKTEVDG